ncbi:MAG: RecQ family ATP-dependent DNA helicase [Planctomycetota bacterium]
MNQPERNPDDYLGQFGLSQFRPAQRDVITSVLEGHDCLCIMPTGGGKSLCYQLPAVMLDGLTLVVSPLIALMKDQVDALCEKGIRAAFINSTLSSQEQYDRLLNVQDGQYDLLYVAPERFRSQRFIELIRSANLKLLAIDEAHCISEWGHDFRHDYARLGRYRKRIGSPRTIALTATATPDVQADVVRQLELEEHRTFIAGFARENLRYRVVHHGSQNEKDETIKNLIDGYVGTGIVYVSTRKACEQVAEMIHESSGRCIGIYHAGLQPNERREVQEAFMSGEVEIVVATNAFGMGIDKPDVRFVIHYNMPGTLEAYYQEAGRAGRDGLMSDCVLLYSGNDQRIQRYFIESAYPAREIVREVYEHLCSMRQEPIEITQIQLKEDMGLDISTEGVGTCERLLEKAGGIQRLEPHRNMAVMQINSHADTLLDFVSPKAKNVRKLIRAVEDRIGEMRFEPVYFQLQSLAERTGLSIQALRKAIGELSNLESFHYVPPFRGRAIHVTDRTRKFGDLEIDFESMDERRKLDYDKLNSMVSYAFTGRCRQWEVLDYFGDPSGKKCGNCDNCRSPGKSANAEVVVELDEDPVIKTVARIALSGVARAKERVGKNAIAAMLCGSQSAKMRKLRLDQVSTFGKLSELKQTDVATFLDAMLRVGWIEQFENEPHRPLMRLTESGRDVMWDRADVNRLAIPKKLARRIRAECEAEEAPSKPKPSTPPKADAETTSDSDSGDSSHRQSNRRDTGAQSPDNEVDDRVREEAALPYRADGQKVDAQKVDAQSASMESRATISVDGITCPSAAYWTWRLVQDGSFSVAEMLEIRNIDRVTFGDHLEQSADAGLEIPLDRILDESEITLIESALLEESRSVQGDATVRIDDLHARISSQISKANLRLFLKCRALATSEEV